MASPASKSHLEEQFALSVLALGLPKPEREFVFAPPRRYRFDFAWPALMIAVEIQGGGQRGRHMRLAGYQQDREKLHLAMLMGWRVYEFTTKHVKSGLASTVIELAITRALETP